MHISTFALVKSLGPSSLHMSPPSTAPHHSGGCTLIIHMLGCTCLPCMICLYRSQEGDSTKYDLSKERDTLLVAYICVTALLLEPTATVSAEQFSELASALSMMSDDLAGRFRCVGYKLLYSKPILECTSYVPPHVSWVGLARSHITHRYASLAWRCLGLLGSAPTLLSIPLHSNTCWCRPKCSLIFKASVCFACQVLR